VITCRAGKIAEVRTHADAQYSTTYFHDETMGTEIKEGRRQGAAGRAPSRRGKPRQRSRNPTNLLRRHRTELCNAVPSPAVVQMLTTRTVHWRI
jgi:hypothetical protein